LNREAITVKRDAAALATLLARLCLLQIGVLGLAAIGLANRRAVDFQRTAHEEPVFDEPRVGAPLAPDRHAIGAAHLERLALVEDVLL